MIRFSGLMTAQFFFHLRTIFSSNFNGNEIFSIIFERLLWLNKSTISFANDSFLIVFRILLMIDWFSGNSFREQNSLHSVREHDSYMFRSLVIRSCYESSVSFASNFFQGFLQHDKLSFFHHARYIVQFPLASNFPDSFVNDSFVMIELFRSLV